jgi:hypothetical protein
VDTLFALGDAVGESISRLIVSPASIADFSRRSPSDARVVQDVLEQRLFGRAHMPFWRDARVLRRFYLLLLRGSLASSMLSIPDLLRGGDLVQEALDAGVLRVLSVYPNLFSPEAHEDALTSTATPELVACAICAVYEALSLFPSMRISKPVVALCGTFARLVSLTRSVAEGSSGNRGRGVTRHVSSEGLLFGQESACMQVDRVVSALTRGSLRANSSWVVISTWADALASHAGTCIAECLSDAKAATAAGAAANRVYAILADAPQSQRLGSAMSACFLRSLITGVAKGRPCALHRKSIY